MIITLSSFTNEEKKEFIKFLESPYFNSDKDFISIYNYILKNDLIQDDDIIQKYGKEKIEKFNILVEKYVSQKEFEKDKNSYLMYLLSGLKSREVPKRFKYLLSRYRKHFENTYKRDENYYSNKISIENEYYNFFLDEFKFDYPVVLDEISETIEMNFYFYYLHNVHNYIVHRFYAGKKFNFNLKFYDQIMKDISKNEKLVSEKHPNVYIIYLAVKIVDNLYEKKDANDLIEKLKHYLQANLKKFDKTQLYYYYGYVINSYQLIIINTNDSEIKKKLIEIYKLTDLENITYINNKISKDKLNNIVYNAIATDDIEWLEYFFKKHDRQIKNNIKENDLRFFYAKISFAKKDFGNTLANLSKVNTKEHIKYFNVKFLLIKSHYELNNFVTIMDEVENLRKFSERNKNLAERHHNIIHSFRQNIKELIKLNEMKKNRNNSFYEEVNFFINHIKTSTEFIPDKKWFTEKLQELIK